MGTVYRETYTKPLPANAEQFTRKGERFARWHDSKGRKRTAKVTTTDAGDRLLIEAGTYTAKLRDGSGLVVKVATGCRSEDAARAVLTELEKRAENVRAGVRTAAEDSVLDHHLTPIASHVAVYVEHLRGKHGKGGKPKLSPVHAENVRRAVERIVKGCDFALLRHLNRQAVERWTKRELEVEKPRSARTLNANLAALCGFGNWCVSTGRLTVNPFARMAKLDEKADRRRQRRALTEAELRRLLHVASVRPLAEHGRETAKLPPEKREGRRTWTKAPLTYATLEAAADRGRELLAEQPELVAELERQGRERALIYKALVLTGLRKGELASLTVGQVELDGATAYATLHAADEKAGRGADVPLRADLAADLRRWLADRLEAARANARAAGEPIPAKLPSTAKLFNVPAGLLKILDRDLAAAGIAKRDDRDRTVDVHSMRHTFGSHLSAGGVAPRTAQAAMRHGSLDLTMNIYTDPRLLDVAGALDALPALPLGDGRQSERMKATGTDAASLVPVLVPTARNQSTHGANADKEAPVRLTAGSAGSLGNVNSSNALATTVGMEPRGIEPLTPSLQS